jgi:hypothetical protein
VERRAEFLPGKQEQLSSQNVPWWLSSHWVR